MLSTEGRVDQLEVLFGQFMTQMTRGSTAMLRLERTTEAMQTQAKKNRRELARQLGDISHKLGSVVVDVIAPSLRRLVSEALSCGQELFFAVRLAKTRPDDPSQSHEFDAFFVGEKAVMLNESKAIAEQLLLSAAKEHRLVDSTDLSDRIR